MALALAEDERSGWSVLQARGELDLGSTGRIRARVHAAVAAGGRRVILDLSGVRFCDSSGVGVLIAARRLMRSCAGELRLVLPREGEHVSRIFAAMGVRRLFDIHPDLESALGLDGRGPVPLTA